MRYLLILITILCQSLAYAKIKIAFYEQRDANGNFLSLDLNGRFYHTALQHSDGWIESIVYYETRVFKEVNHDPKNQGQLYSIIEIDHPEIAKERYQAELTKGFFTRATWSSCKTTYCSKLVAQLLDIPPLPMTSYVGEGLGLSPDDLYQILKQRPHREMLACPRVFSL